MNFTLTEPCGVNWRGQWLRLTPPAGQRSLVDEASGRHLPCQTLSDASVLCCVDLDAGSVLRAVWSPQDAPSQGPGTTQDTLAEVSTGTVDDAFLLANGHIEVRLARSFAAGASSPGPLLGVRRRGESWLANARFEGDVEGGSAWLAEPGPLCARYEARLRLVGGGEYVCSIELRAGEEWLHISERFSGGLSARNHVARTVFDFSSFEARTLITDGWPGKAATAHDARTYEQPFGLARGVLASLGAQTVFGQVGAPWAVLSDGGTALGAVVAAGGNWEFPGDATLRLRRCARSLELGGECGNGSRTWLLLCGEATEWMPGPDEAATAISRLKARVCDLPLAKVLGWELHGEDPPEPVLWTDKAGFAEARERLQAPEWSGLIASIPNREGAAPHTEESRCYGLCGTTDSFPDGVSWLQTGATADGRAMARQICEWATAAARRFVEGGFLGAGLDVVWLRPLKLCLYWHDLLRGSGLMSADEAAELRRALLCCAYCLHDRDYFDWESACAPVSSPHSLRRFLLEEDYSDTMGCQNFHSDIYSYLGAVGLAFPNHPMSRAWVEHAEAMAALELECFVVPDGTYVESDNYYQHFLGLIYYLGYALHRAGRPRLSEHPRLKAGLEYWVRSQTPPLTHPGSPATAWYGTYTALPGARPIAQMPPLGDCGLNWGGQALPSFLHHAANFYAASEPQLAGWLEWTWRRAGRPLAQYSFLIQEMLTQRLDAPAPIEYPLRSGELDGHGVFLRSGVGTARETGLLVSCGRATSHMHWDAGSLQLWHGGVPLIVDPGYIHDEFTDRRQYGGASWKHSAVTFGAGDAWSNGYLGMEHRQSPRAVKLGEDYEYVECDLSQNNVRGASWRDVRRIVSIEHYRQVLFARDRYVVVHDRIHRSIYDSTWHLWLLSESEDIDGNFVLVRGRFGVDLGVTFVNPQEARIHAEEYAPARHIWVTEPPEGNYTVVLQPLLPGQKPYAVAPLPGGVEVSGADWTDQVFLDPLPGLNSAGHWHRPPQFAEPSARCSVVRDGRVQIVQR